MQQLSPGSIDLFQNETVHGLQNFKAYICGRDFSVRDQENLWLQIHTLDCNVFTAMIFTLITHMNHQRKYYIVYFNIFLLTN